MTSQAKRGFFPFVTGEEVDVRQAGAMAIAARNDLSMQQGGGRIMAAGHDMEVTQGGGSLMAAGNNLSVTAGGGGLIAAGNSITLTDSIAGVVIGRTVQVDEGSRVVFGSVGSLAAGAVAGMGIALVLGLVRRIRR